VGAELILVRPLGFEFSEKALRRAQLDYASEVSISLKDSLEEALQDLTCPLFFLSSKTKTSLYDQNLTGEVALIFGNENSGLPQETMSAYASKLVRLPMIDDVRCLNLSNAVAISVYEVWRQNGFKYGA
jgi:tRNA (cytidine/uridine-2'-O-)-methyltransferase